MIGRASSSRPHAGCLVGGGGKPYREAAGLRYSFVGEEAAGGVGDVGGVDAGGGEEFGGGAGAGHLADGEVGDGQVGDGQVGAAGAGQGVQDRGAEAALGVVVLGDDQPSAGGRGGRGGRGERSGVRRLDRGPRRLGRGPRPSLGGMACVQIRMFGARSKADWVVKHLPVDHDLVSELRFSGLDPVRGL